MNSLGLNIIFKMGCLCSHEILYVNKCKYKVLERLGEGGFSNVDLVQNEYTKRKFALKRVKCHSKEDEKIALREIDVYKKIRHVNVIELLDFDIIGDADILINTTSEIYMLLPYYRQGTLQHHLDIKATRKEHWSKNDLLTIFLSICEGVRAFHDAVPEPYAHRDLKTSNICLEDDMTPIIMDLGSATEARVKICGVSDAQKLQELASERCSMPYKAPELFNVESYCMVDERTDIWSLGCILYAMCFFKSPFDIIHERGDSVALAVISGNITFPEEGPYDRSIHDLISFMLKLNPMERPYIYSVIEKTLDLLAQNKNEI